MLLHRPGDLSQELGVDATAVARPSWRLRPGERVDHLQGHADPSMLYYNGVFPMAQTAIIMVLLNILLTFLISPFFYKNLLPKKW
jgi:hypothetical protein